MIRALEHAAGTVGGKGQWGEASFEAVGYGLIQVDPGVALVDQRTNRFKRHECNVFKVGVSTKESPYFTFGKFLLLQCWFQGFVTHPSHPTEASASRDTPNLTLGEARGAGGPPAQPSEDSPCCKAVSRAGTLCGTDELLKDSSLVQNSQVVSSKCF